MVRQILIVSILSLCFIMLFFYIFQRHLIYFPTHQTLNLQDYHATDMVLVSLYTKDNLVLTSWYKPALHNQPTVLFLHGNAGHIGYRMPLARQFINAGFGIFLLEYRGYGENRGSPTEEGLYEDARTALRFLYENEVALNQIILYGESLGTGIATKLAAENTVCAVILQSPFTSLASLSRYHYPWLIIKPWDQFDSLKRIKQIHAPLLVLHGKRDQVVPFDEGLTLFNQANEPKKMLVFDDKNHNDLWDSPDFYKEIFHFIRMHCLNK
ncbi:MAG: alpha/beta hydrolase [Legionella sp.]|uniref:alpha/beta hydrolase n=1 Tax=Legionella sp. TaxID=459 RepID=UPI0039E3A310